ncbi:MAG: PAS domain S-box protein, partial [Nitriliruptoraceae bacterium]
MGTDPRRGVERIAELEQQLAVSEQRFRLAMAHAPSGMALLDLDCHLLAVNQTLCEFLGRSEAELLTMTSLEVTHPDDVDEDVAYGNRIVDGEHLRPIEKRYVRPDGSIVWGLLGVSIVTDASGSPIQMIGQVVDVTDRQVVQQVRDRNEWLAHAAVSLGRIGGWAIDLASRRVEWATEVFEVMDHSGAEEPELDAILDLLETPDRRRVTAALERCETEGIPFDVEVGIHSFTGRRMHGRLIGQRQVDTRGRATHIIGAFQDLTEQRAAEEHASRLAVRLTTTLESITDAVYTLDREWRFTFLNGRAEQLLQRTRGELLGQVVWDEFPEAVDTDVYAAFHRALDEQVTVDVDSLYYSPLNTWFEVHAFPSEQGVAVYFRDIGERVERQRSQQAVLTAEREASERLRSLDRMKNSFLSAVSHELRTPLAIVQGNAATLRRLRGSLPESTRNQLEDALADHAKRLDDLLADLLDIDRLTRASAEVLDAPFDAVALLRRVVAQNAQSERIVVDAPDDLTVVADPVQIERILVNLIDNATKYAPDGTVTVQLAPIGD